MLLSLYQDDAEEGRRKVEGVKKMERRRNVTSLTNLNKVMITELATCELREMIDAGWEFKSSLH